ncbi:MAG: VWA domain-containing protein [Acidobacteriota bacterium]
MKGFIAALAVLALALPMAATAQSAHSLILSHARQTGDLPPRLQVYLDVVDDEGRAVTAIAPPQLTGTLGQERLDLDRLRPFDATGEGVGYLFLVDISKSLSEAQFRQIRSALGTWLGDLRPADRAAILAFGDSSRLVVDFTSDVATLRAGLDDLGPTDQRTLLHRALVDALELGRQRDQQIPGRRVLVVLTDGKDEGSGLLPEDVLTKLRQDPMPIYAIGVSKLPTAEQQRYLEVLHRFASNSGGAFYTGSESFEDQYGEIRDAIRRVWVAEMSCAGCRVDGESYRLQLQLEHSGRRLSQGTDLRLLPTVSSTAASGSGTAASSSVEGSAGDPQGRDPMTAEPPPPAGGEVGPDTATSPQTTTETPRTDPGRSDPTAATDPADRATTGAARPWWKNPTLWLILLALGLLGWLLSLRRRKQPREEPAPSEDLEATAALGDLPTEDGEATMPGAAAIAAAGGIDPPGAEITGVFNPRSVRFVVLRGSRKGKEYRLLLRNKATIGSRSTCDLVLADEEDIAAEQFELVQLDRQVFIRNLAERAPTLVNGLTLSEGQTLKTNDLVGTRGTIFRTVIF